MSNVVSSKKVAEPTEKCASSEKSSEVFHTDAGKYIKHRDAKKPGT